MKILTPSNKSFADSLSEAFVLLEPIPDDSDEYYYYNILIHLSKDYIPLYLTENLLKEFTREYYEKRKVIYMYFMMSKPVDIIENTVKELRNLQGKYGRPLDEFELWTTFFDNLISYKKLSHSVSKEDYFIPKLNKI